MEQKYAALPNGVEHLEKNNAIGTERNGDWRSKGADAVSVQLYGRPEVSTRIKYQRIEVDDPPVTGLRSRIKKGKKRKLIWDQYLYALAWADVNHSRSQV